MTAAKICDWKQLGVQAAPMYTGVTPLRPLLINASSSASDRRGERRPKLRKGVRTSRIAVLAPGFYVSPCTI
jgi:hypothetical protein